MNFICRCGYSYSCSPSRSCLEQFEQQAKEKVSAIPWVKGVNVKMTAQPAKPLIADDVPAGLKKVSNIVAVSSCKVPWTLPLHSFGMVVVNLHCFCPLKHLINLQLVLYGYFCPTPFSCTVYVLARETLQRDQPYKLYTLESRVCFSYCFCAGWSWEVHSGSKPCVFTGTNGCKGWHLRCRHIWSQPANYGVTRSESIANGK